MLNELKINEDSLEEIARKLHAIRGSLDPTEEAE